MNLINQLIKLKILKVNKNNRNKKNKKNTIIQKQKIYQEQNQLLQKKPKNHKYQMID